MFPDKHLRDLKSSNRRARLFGSSLIALLFILSFLILGPLLHETAHIAMLELRNCGYLFDIVLMLPHGINAEVKPLCAIKPAYLLLFYSSGYLATLLIGVSLNIIGSVRASSLSSKYLTAVGTGMLLSVILTIGVEGDIQNAFEVMRLNTGYARWVSMVIVLGVLASTVHGLDTILDLERKE